MMTLPGKQLKTHHSLDVVGFSFQYDGYRLFTNGVEN
jgi:hypothetical protein